MAFPTIDLGGTNANTGGTSTVLVNQGVTEHKSVYRLPGHTTREPRLVLFKRTPPVISSANTGVGKVEVKVVYGDIDTFNGVLPKNTICTFTLSLPVANSVSEAKQAVNVLQQILMDTALTDGLVDYQDLPQS